MNNMWSDVQVKSRPMSFWEKTPYTKEFSYAVRLSADECLARLHDLAKPQTGFWNPSSRTVKITHEVNHVRFEICSKRYGRGFVYSSAVAEGIVIAAAEHPEIRVIKGNVRLGVMIWLYLLVLGVLTLVSASTGDLAYSLPALAICFVFVRRDYNDYQQLRVLLHDTFAQTDIAG